MSFTFDASNTGIKPLEDGEYEVYPSAWALEEAKTTGNRMIQMNYTVRGDVQQAGQGAEVRYDNFVLVDSSMWRANALTAAVGGFSDRYDFGSAENWAEMMLGRPVRVRVEQTVQNNGKTYPEVKFFMPSNFPQLQEQPRVKHHQAGGQQPVAAAPRPTYAEIQAANQRRAAAPAGAQMPPMPPMPPMAPNPPAPAAPFVAGASVDISDDDLPF
ncbi:DUF669 domain-containing protein [Lacticaseibacillus daqingensis]|uniref:DUF669 domain-containing protein n=1 Tax=Lacticaseibacillus daqingensis TaxID=2486014 RepID=UPI000F7A9046|nr:DUF669 domain-containing protein [Lacticaseibacillus daqingensis]